MEKRRIIKESSKMSEVWSILFLLFIGIGLGVSGTMIYKGINYQRDLNGLRLESKQINNSDQAKQYAQRMDPGGNWICINVRDMTVKEMINTCEHESAHEIFARECEDNATRCVELVSK